MDITQINNINNKHIIQHFFSLVKKKQQDKIIQFIDDNKHFDFNIRNQNNIHLVFFIVIFNLNKVLKHLLHLNFSIDVLDNDGRSINYYIVKLNHIDILQNILTHYNQFIGFPIINFKDNFGLSTLHYCIVFNNIDILKILYSYKNINLLITDNDGNNILHFSIINKNKHIIQFLIDNKFPIHHTNSKSQNALHLLLIHFPDNNFIHYFIKNNIDITLQDKSLHITPLHLSLSFNIDFDIQNYTSQQINITDFNGNTPLHYALIENNIHLFNKIYNHNKDIINFNIQNINGDTLLHIILENDINIKNDFIQHIINHTNINLQNNQGNTITHILIHKNKFLSFNYTQKINPFILNNENIYTFQMNNKNYHNKIFNTISQTLATILIKDRTNASLQWEKICSFNDCIKHIRKYIENNKSLPPFTIDPIQPILDTGIFVDKCRYIGNTLDIISGLLFLKSNFDNITLPFLFPLTIHDELITYLKSIGNDISQKLDFINFQIFWSFQKIIYPTFFDELLQHFFKSNNRFLILPLAIHNDISGHANIILIDKILKTVERFEPNGSYSPRELDYNHNTLDNILQNKFSIYKLTYIKPTDFLPPIGFQALENLETIKCKNIHDPNGFCAVWCIWWIFHKIKNIQIDSNILSYKLINKIKLSNVPFKTIIRNFAHSITDIRDDILSQINIDINKWINNNYDLQQINKLQQIILSK